MYAPSAGWEQGILTHEPQCQQPSSVASNVLLSFGALVPKNSVGVRFAAYIPASSAANFKRMATSACRKTDACSSRRRWSSTTSRSTVMHHHEKFVSAVISAPLPGTSTYRAAVEPFRNLQAHRVRPEYRKWKRRHPAFLGVAECVNLLRQRNGLREIILWELYSNAQEHPKALIDAFQCEEDPFMRFSLLYTIADARLPKAFPVFVEHLKCQEKLLRDVSIEGLRYLGTAKARKVLQEAGLISSRT
jgi:hypothetical protein